MTLVAGCYERFLFGFNHPDSASAEEPELARSFTHAAHKGVVKSLASAGPFVASGGADDLIHLYDLKGDKDLGFLMNPGEGAISSLCFFTPAGAYTPTHLLSGCSDGTISVWKAGGGWECMRTLRGHRGEISSIAVHPSGCLALTTSRDGTLKLWDLVKGRVTFSTKIGNDSDLVVFAPSGIKYALQAGSSVIVKPVSSGGSEAHDVKLQHSRRVLSMCFGSGGDDILITGAEDGALRVWNVKNGQELLHIPRAHATRIKALTAAYANDSSSSKKKSSKGSNSSTNVVVLDQVPHLLATASSDGVIKLWNLREAVAAAVKRGNPEAEDGGESACLCDTNTKARLTTLCAVDPIDVMELRLREQSEAKQIAVKKKKKKQAGEKPPEKKRKVHDGEEKRGKGSAGAVMKKKKEELQKQKPGSGVVRKDGTVSFIEEEDVKRQSKKQRQVQIAAKRKADQRSGQHRRANVPGSKAQ